MHEVAFWSKLFFRLRALFSRTRATLQRPPDKARRCHARQRQLLRSEIGIFPSASSTSDNVLPPVWRTLFRFASLHGGKYERRDRRGRGASPDFDEDCLGRRALGKPERPPVRSNHVRIACFSIDFEPDGDDGSNHAPVAIRTTCGVTTGCMFNCSQPSRFDERLRRAASS